MRTVEDQGHRRKETSHEELASDHHGKGHRPTAPGHGEADPAGWPRRSGGCWRWPACRSSGGARRPRRSPAAPEPPEVQVTPVVQQDVPIYSEWVGTTVGYVTAQIRARMSGYLLSQHYTEGAFVKSRGPVVSDRPPPVPGRRRSGRGQPRPGAGPARAEPRPSSPKRRPRSSKPRPRSPRPRPP